jgi:hypothetical protein
MGKGLQVIVKARRAERSCACRHMKSDADVGQQRSSEAQVVVENCLFLASFR